MHTYSECMKELFLWAQLDYTKPENQIKENYSDWTQETWEMNKI